MVCVVAALAAFLRWRLSVPDVVHRFELPLLVAEGLAWALVILGMLLLPVAFRPLCTNGFFKWLGVLSYSIYLVHFPLLALGLKFARDTFPDPVGPHRDSASLLWITVLTIVCLGLSTLTYRFIEQPFLALKSRANKAA